MEKLRKILTLLVLICGCFIVMGCGSFNCPKHQHLAVVSWYPLTINKTTVIEPIYGCVKND